MIVLNSQQFITLIAILTREQPPNSLTIKKYLEIVHHIKYEGSEGNKKLIFYNPQQELIFRLKYSEYL